MKIYIMRHGASPTVTESRVDSDFERPLSLVGRAEARKAASYLLSQGARPGLILVSPLRRAQETSKEVAGVLKPAPKLRTYEPLSNQISGPEVFRQILEDKLGESEVLLIGHMPQLGELAAHLVGGVFQLKTAGVIALETDAQARAKLLWRRNPEEIHA